MCVRSHVRNRVALLLLAFNSRPDECQRAGARAAWAVQGPRNEKGVPAGTRGALAANWQKVSGDGRAEEV